jgi:hypothetical protein
MIIGKHKTDRIDHLATAPIERDKFKGNTYLKTKECLGDI